MSICIYRDLSQKTKNNTASFFCKETQKCVKLTKEGPSLSSLSTKMRGRQKLRANCIIKIKNLFFVEPFLLKWIVVMCCYAHTFGRIHRIIRTLSQKEKLWWAFHESIKKFYLRKRMHANASVSILQISTFHFAILPVFLTLRVVWWCSSTVTEKKKHICIWKSRASGKAGWPKSTLHWKSKKRIRHDFIECVVCVRFILSCFQANKCLCVSILLKKRWWWKEKRRKVMILRKINITICFHFCRCGMRVLTFLKWSWRWWLYRSSCTYLYQCVLYTLMWW